MYDSNYHLRDIQTKLFIITIIVNASFATVNIFIILLYLVDSFAINSA